MNFQIVSQTAVICLAVAALSFWAVWVSLYLLDKYKNRFKQHQIDTRRQIEDNKRYAAVQELIAQLHPQVVFMCGNSALHTLDRISDVEAAVNKVLASWKDYYAGDFPVVDGIIIITGVKNGNFTYKLPQQLEKYRKRR